MDPKHDAERALVDALPQLYVSGITYRRRWWAGLSDYPGDGFETVVLERESDVYAGTVEVQVRGYNDANALCRSPVRVQRNLIQAQLDELPKAKVTYGIAANATIDGGADHMVELRSAELAPLRFAQGSLHFHSRFWAAIPPEPDMRAAFYSGEVALGIDSPQLSRLCELLRSTWELSEQSDRIWQLLKNWRLSVPKV